MNIVCIYKKGKLSLKHCEACQLLVQGKTTYLPPWEKGQPIRELRCPISGIKIKHIYVRDSKKWCPEKIKTNVDTKEKEVEKKKPFKTKSQRPW